MDKIRNYSWVMFGIAALLLVASGIVFIFDKDNVESILINVVARVIGIGVIAFGLMRVRGITIYKKSNLLLGLHIGEIAYHVIVGALFLAFPETVAVKPYFGPIIGSIFYLRAILYFYGVVYKEISADIVSFWANVGFMSIGFWLILNWKASIKHDNIITGVIVLMFISAVFLGYKSYSGYVKYKQMKATRLKLSEHDDKVKSNSDESKKEDPTETNIDDQDKVIEDKVDIDELPVGDEIEEEVDVPTSTNDEEVEENSVQV